jgi:hypothetical protein
LNAPLNLCHPLARDLVSALTFPPVIIRCKTGCGLNLLTLRNLKLYLISQRAHLRNNVNVMSAGVFCRKAGAGH